MQPGLDEKKTIYQATFEESESFVSNIAIERAIEHSQSKVVNKRLFGVIFIYFLLYLVYLLFQFAKLRTHDNLEFVVLRIPLFWIITSGCICIPYIVCVIKNRNKQKVNLPYYYNFYSTLSVIVLILFMFIFSLDLANSVLKSSWVYILYSLLFIIFIFDLNRKVTKNIEMKLYGTEKNLSNIVDFFQKNQKYFGILGGLIIGLKLLYNLLFSNSGNGESDFVSAIIMALFPLLMFVGVLVPIYLKDEILVGYYIAKYSEEYRLKYGYSNLEWYGKNSNEYKKEKFI